MLTTHFFDQDAMTLAKALLGKVMHAKYNSIWLSAMIIETEAYYLNEKSSHSSLGYTEKRKALFMPPGTIYMYYARGGDSLNISCQGEGNAVLIKSAFPYLEEISSPSMINIMQQLNPQKNILTPRPLEELCSGQTLLCKALGLKVKEWDQQAFCKERFFISDIGYKPEKIIQTTRLGIPIGRDHQLPFRFIDYDKAKFCTSNPLTKKLKDYSIIAYN